MTAHMTSSFAPTEDTELPALSALSSFGLSMVAKSISGKKADRHCRRSVGPWVRLPSIDGSAVRAIASGDGEYYCQFCGGWSDHRTADHDGNGNDPARENLWP